LAMESRGLTGANNRIPHARLSVSRPNSGLQ
jgi:hypothetical protein